MRLATPRLVLRELEESDAVPANEYERLPHVVRYQSHEVRTLTESLEYILRSKASADEQPRRVYDLAVTLAVDGGYIGRAGLHVTVPAQREGALWYILAPDYWGRGFATEAAGALLDFGFEALRLHRIYIECDARNTASVRVAQKLGMRHEAHLVENVFQKSEWTDSLYFAMLEREWAAKRAL